MDFVNGPQSQFGRRDSYPVCRAPTPHKAMTRFTFRVTSASALVLMTTIAVCFVVCEAWAQENERPFGLFGLFNGSDRLGGEIGAPPPAADRTSQITAPRL